jgi:hypothetical protein
MRVRWAVPAAVILLALAVTIGAWGVARGRHHALYDAFLIPLVAERVAIGALPMGSATGARTRRTSFFACLAADRAIRGAVVHSSHAS